MKCSHTVGQKRTDPTIIRRHCIAKHDGARPMETMRSWAALTALFILAFFFSSHLVPAHNDRHSCRGVETTSSRPCLLGEPHGPFLVSGPRFKARTILMAAGSQYAVHQIAMTLRHGVMAHGKRTGPSSYSASWIRIPPSIRPITTRCGTLSGLPHGRGDWCEPQYETQN